MNSSHKFTALIADDEKDIVELMTSLLEKFDIKVIGKASNGKEAYEIFKREKPDLAILDLKMPEYDGQYAISKITEENPNAKILVVSGFTNYPYDEEKVAAIIQKPYEVKSLLEKIDYVMKTNLEYRNSVNS